MLSLDKSCSHPPLLIGKAFKISFMLSDKAASCSHSQVALKELTIYRTYICTYIYTKANLDKS